MSYLYSEADVFLMTAAEEARIPGGNRVDELVRFAGQLALTRIGIAHCITFSQQAQWLQNHLQNKGFEVFCVDCKCGKVSKSDLLGEKFSGVMCNPVGQAEYLAHRKTSLNIAFGLCVGHDLLFSSKSAAPVTTLVVKDRQLANNPFQLFTSP
jgi:uncharacterized metal-binding protein